MGPLIGVAWIASGCGLLVDFGAEGSGSRDAGDGFDAGALDGRVPRDTGGPSDARDEETGVDASVDSGRLLGSCREILDAGLSGGNGDYVISVGGVATTVYCDMDAGGWTRVGTIDPVAGCPGELVAATDSVPGCWAPMTGSCTPGRSFRVASVSFEPVLSSYSEIRGFARGRQHGTTDAFAALEEVGYRSIEEPYVDGLSITVGAPREHVWTFAAGLFDFAALDDPNMCPCATGRPPPSFVADAYDCDASNTDGGALDCRWHDGTLWDVTRSCDVPATEEDVPFEVNVGPRSDPIDLRLLLDQDDENISIQALELYVR